MILIGASGLNTLYHLRHAQRFAAERGRHGEGSDKTGRSGKDVEIRLPLGTVVRDEESGEVLAEILADGDRVPVARGGRGGKGNARFATATRQTPDFAEKGSEGEEVHLRLELKLLADVGLVGLPNAGKSTFVSVVSAARPKIAEYPFTTLIPNLGVVALDRLSDPFVVADLPGLIAGAASGAGLGTQFLRHVERCRVLAHLVDLSNAESSVEEELRGIENELEAFNPDLLRRSRVVVASKLDAAIEDRRSAARRAAADRDLEHFEISSVTGEGIEPLLRRFQVLLASGSPR